MSLQQPRSDDGWNDCDEREWVVRGIELAKSLYDKLGPFSPQDLRAVADALELTEPIGGNERAPGFVRGVVMGYRIIAAWLEDEAES